MHATPDVTSPRRTQGSVNARPEDEQSAFTLLVPSIQHSLFATPCAQSATPSRLRPLSAAFTSSSSLRMFSRLIGIIATL
jgi:hypothetical protein